MEAAGEAVLNSAVEVKFVPFTSVEPRCSRTPSRAESPGMVSAWLLTGVGSTTLSPRAGVSPKCTMLVEATSVVQWICTEFGWI